MSDLADLRARIAEQFHAAFGHTPLPQRIEDIVAQANSLSRVTDLDHVRDEAGDLISAVLQLCNEHGWEPADLVKTTLDKIAHEKFISDEIGTLLDALADYEKELDYDSDDASLIRTTRRDWEKAHRVPAELAAEMTGAAADAHDVWAKARADSDADSPT